MCFDLVVQLVVEEEGNVKPFASDEAKIKIDDAKLNSAIVAISTGWYLCYKQSIESSLNTANCQLPTTHNTQHHQQTHLPRVRNSLLRGMVAPASTCTNSLCSCRGPFLCGLGLSSPLMQARLAISSSQQTNLLVTMAAEDSAVWSSIAQSSHKLKNRIQLYEAPIFLLLALPLSLLMYFPHHSTLCEQGMEFGKRYQVIIRVATNSTHDINFAKVEAMQRRRVECNSTCSWYFGKHEFV